MSLETERFGVPTSLRAQRVEAFERERAVDQLAGRTVWCAGALGRASERASGLRERLGWAHDGGVDAAQLQVHGTEPLREAAAQLESMLNDVAGDPRAPGRDERALYTERTARAEEDVAPRVRAEDVVVLHDPLSAALAHAVRERGGHALWHVRIAAAPCGARSEEAWTFLREFTSDMNAYLVSWSARGRSGGSMHRIAALMPSSGVGFVKEFTDRGKDLAWSSLLADVLEHDRVECVGGTLHVRPTVAAR
jgi:hypothetical protein